MRSIAIVCLITAMLGCGSVPISDQTPAKTQPYTCEAARELILDGKGAPPTTYDEVVRFPRECRHVIFNVLAPAGRSALWQEHFNRYLGTHPLLTPEQRAVIERAKELMTPSFYEVPDEQNEKIDAQMREIEKGAEVQFGKLGAAWLLGQIGPVPEKLPEQ